jgi:hypothetical protein
MLWFACCHNDWPPVQPYRCPWSLRARRADRSPSQRNHRGCPSEEGRSHASFCKSVQIDTAMHERTECGTEPAPTCNWCQSDMSASNVARVLHNAKCSKSSVLHDAKCSKSRARQLAQAPTVGRCLNCSPIGRVRHRHYGCVCYECTVTHPSVQCSPLHVVTRAFLVARTFLEQCHLLLFLHAQVSFSRSDVVFACTCFSPPEMMRAVHA